MVHPVLRVGGRILEHEAVHRTFGRDVGGEKASEGVPPDEQTRGGDLGASDQGIIDHQGVVRERVDVRRSTAAPVSPVGVGPVFARDAFSFETRWVIQSAIFLTPTSAALFLESGIPMQKLLVELRLPIFEREPVSVDEEVHHVGRRLKRIAVGDE